MLIQISFISLLKRNLKQEIMNKTIQTLDKAINNLKTLMPKQNNNLNYETIELFNINLIIGYESESFDNEENTGGNHVIIDIITITTEDSEVNIYDLLESKIDTIKERLSEKIF